MTQTEDHGEPGTARYNLYRRYRSMEKAGKTGWETFEDFVKWSEENGHFRGSFLRKIESGKPMGPDNSFWSETPAYYYTDTRTTCSNECEFCKDCTRRKKPELCNGCREYEEWFVKNWNKHIHRDVEDVVIRLSITETEVGSRFQYEHPDIEREQKMRQEGKTEDDEQ